MAWRDVRRSARRSYLRRQEPASDERLRRHAASRPVTASGTATGSNRNAALTVFRHFDSASVVQGPGRRGRPKTAWVIGYPLFERIYYLLVAGYDVYGNVGAPARHAPVHGFHAHGGRIQFPDLAAQGVARADRATTGTAGRQRRGQVLVRRRRQEPASSRDRQYLPHRGSPARALRPAGPAPAPGAGASASIWPACRTPACGADLRDAGRRARRQPGLAARVGRCCASTIRRARRSTSACCATPPTAT